MLHSLCICSHCVPLLVTTHSLSAASYCSNMLRDSPVPPWQMSHNLSSQPQYAPASPCRMQSPPDWPSAAAEGASTAGPCCSYWPPDVSQQHENLAQICAVCCLPASNATRNLQGVLCCRACIPAWRKQQDVLPNSADKALLQQTQQRVQHHAIARPSLQEDLLVDECLQQHQVRPEGCVHSSHGILCTMPVWHNVAADKLTSGLCLQTNTIHLQIAGNCAQDYFLVMRDSSSTSATPGPCC